MTVINVLKTAAVLIQNKELLKSLSENDFSSDSAENILAAYNLVVSELSESVRKLIETENVLLQNNRCYYSNLSKSVTEIIKVLKNEKEIAFSVNPTYFSANETEVCVVYAYYPERAEFLSDSVYSNTEITERILALGVAAEYSLILGQYEESLVWRTRFIEAVKNAAPISVKKTIKPRLWF